MYTPALLTINSISFDFLNYPKWINAKVASFVFHNTFHYVMMMNMNIKARQPRRQYEPSHTASSSSPSYYVGQAVGVLHHVPLENMALLTALYSSSNQF
jgi:hypothetical protein